MKKSTLYRSYINFTNNNEAKAFFKQLKVFRSVKDIRINNAYVDPRRFGECVRIDIEADSNEVFEDIYREITVHLLLGNGFSPVSDTVLKYGDVKEEKELIMINKRGDSILNKIMSA